MRKRVLFFLMAFVLSLSLFSIACNKTTLANDITYDDFTPVFRMGVLADTHIDAQTSERNAKFQAGVSKLMAEGGEEGLDAFMIAGDLTQDGNDTQVQLLKTLWNEANTGGVPLFASLGNHDFYTGSSAQSKSRYSSILGVEANSYTLVKGIPVITVSADNGMNNYSSQTLAWLSNTLQEAAAAAPGKPILVTTHAAIENTTMGTHEISFNHSTSLLTPILAEYPQVIIFTGHLHNSHKTENSIHQRDFTAVNVGPTQDGGLAAYDFDYETIDGDYYSEPLRRRINEGLLVEIDAEGNTYIKRYNFNESGAHEVKWFIKAPTGTKEEIKASFTYTDDRALQPNASSPVGNLEIEGLNRSEIQFSFSQFAYTNPNDLPVLYEVKVIDKETGYYQEKRISSYYYRVGSEISKKLTVKFSELQPTTDYTIEIRAMNAFKVYSAAWRTDFSTNDSNEKFPIIYETFDSLKEDYQIVPQSGGVAEVKDGKLHVKGKKPDNSGDQFLNTTGFAKRELADFTFEFEYTTSNPNNEKMLFHSGGNEGTGHALQIRPSYIQISKASDYDNPYVRYDISIKKNVPYRVKMVMQGRNIKVFFNELSQPAPESPVMDYTIPDGAYFKAEGDFYWCSWGGISTIDNVKIFDSADTSIEEVVKEPLVPDIAVPDNFVLIYENDYQDMDLSDLVIIAASGKSGIKTQGNNKFLRLIIDKEGEGNILAKFGPQNVGDFIMTFRMRQIKASNNDWNWAYIGFHAQEGDYGNNAVNAEIFPRGSAFSVRSAEHGYSDTTKIGISGPTAGSYNPNHSNAYGMRRDYQWHQVTIGVFGNSYSMYIDNLLVVTATDVNKVFEAGDFLFGSYGNCFDVDDIFIWAESGALQDSLNVNIENNKLRIEVADAVSSYRYQFWIKTKVTTDGSDNLNNRQYIWQVCKPYNLINFVELDISSGNFLVNDYYEIIVRVKDAQDAFVSEIYGRYSPGELNSVIISAVYVNGKGNEAVYVIDKGEGEADIEIFGSGAEGTVYSLYVGETLLASNDTGKFSVDFDGFENGFYLIKAKASNGTNSDEKLIKVYVFGSYNAGQVAVIKELTGTSDENGLTTFVMKLAKADGSNILAQDAGDYDIRLYSQGQPLNLAQLRNNGEGVLEAVFIKDYGNKYGIYTMTGTVRRKSVNGDDDKIIVYYSGYARSATLSQDCSGNTAQAGETLTIISSGTIEGVSGENLKYAYYREDASGWVLIRDYSSSGTLTWTPTRPGIYHIQVRIKADGAGSYEKAVTGTYTITGTDLSSDILTVTAYDYETGGQAENYIAGRPYKITADYAGEEDVLYMFTLYSANLGTVYLNKYTTDDSIMFIPNKSDTYIITARVISLNSYGFKDISTSITIISNVE